ncbi:MAG: hypothetical protein VX798_11470 [Bacteroidota bacterium]|uniref:DUF998 domain-containing protein n=1 Tax=Flagellimonas profundi TaxID=2915620 RepID=A0ABS3FDD6_9FLAO|nr:hypothetical protein [Allomuricauda profundi]MBO0341063.1 hypothetical protein [Allomuricauda profundi]MEC7771795.1 hypothetical protein [Bacteroidota bacterium]
MRNTINQKGLFKFLPTIGILVFIGIYFYASKLYPGGSLVDVNSAGFDWLNNHWCNLMRENGLNGVQNGARPVAIAGITILCGSMIIFFFQFADHFEKNGNWKNIIRISGTLAMLSACFIFTIYHNIMTTILSVFGTMVIIGMLRALYKNRLIFLMVMGVFCILIVGLNNFFYYNENLTQYSPIIQKIAFVLILSWTVCLNLTINKSALKQRL